MELSNTSKPMENEQRMIETSNNNINIKQNNTETQYANRKNPNLKLLNYDELPNYMKDNEFILRYYRSEWPLKNAFFSLFQWHNETLNIWTHLLGFALFLWLTAVNAANVSEAAYLFGFFRDSPYKVPHTKTFHNSSEFLKDMTRMVDDMKNKNPTSHQATHHIVAMWPLYIYLSGSMFCLISSTICHLFCCHSHPLNLFLLRLDYTGITIMIITSFFPPIYYIFQCQPLCQILYLAGISLFGTVTIATLLSPACASGKYRPIRAILFTSMGLFGLVPAIHACVLNWTNPRRNLTLAYESSMALAYLIGTGFYVSQVPERWRPGWFDLVGHSHQIFHVFVVLGALAHYGASLVFMQYKDDVKC